MAKNSKLYLVNDYSILNHRYRSNILNFKKSGFSSIDSIGLFDSFSKFFFTLTVMLFRSKSVITSNLKTNLVFMMFFGKSGTIILNGLGRFSKINKFRKAVGFLLSLNAKKTIFVQNYRDYRYFRRFYNWRLIWLPGSGGIKRKYFEGSEYFSVTRNSKFLAQYDRLQAALMALPNVKSFSIVGLSSPKVINLDSRLKFCGYVDQSQIFMFGNKYVHLAGYGEGIPHVLVDALVTGLTVYIEKAQFLEFGLNLLGYRFVYIRGGWGKCLLVDVESQNRIKYHNVAEKVFQPLIKELAI